VWKLYSNKKKKEQEQQNQQEQTEQQNQQEQTEQQNQQEQTDKIKKERPSNRRYIPLICLVAAGVFFIAVGVRELITEQREYAEARDEYQQLWEEFSEVINRQTPPPDIDADDDPEDIEEEIEEEAEEEEESEEERSLRDLSLDELSRMNRDFVGWMSISGVLEYPVVRGSDNSRYVYTTFSGNLNRAGTIFMDYRNDAGFGGKVSVLYGHNMRDGSMFAPVARYLDPGFLQSNPNIRITLPNGNVLNYRAFAAIFTTAEDYIYSVAINNSEKAPEVFPNVPENASRFLLLSTCTHGDRDERIIVFAALGD